MAIPEIERILSCDESGRAAIEKAQEDSEELISRAEQEIKDFQRQAQAEIDQFKQKEISAILQDADKKAKEVEREARDYCHSLEELFAGQEEELVNEFLKRFYREAGLEKDTL